MQRQIRPAYRWIFWQSDFSYGRSVISRWFFKVKWFVGSNAQIQMVYL